MFRPELGRNRCRTERVIHSVGGSVPAYPNCNGILQGVPSYAGRHQYSICDYRRKDEANFTLLVME